MIELLKKMISIPSFSREETAVADVLQQWMEDNGLSVHRKGNNVWTSSSDADDSRPTLLLNAHIDTVRPAAGYHRDPFNPQLEGDRLYGLGSNDDGGSVIALLAAYMQLTSRPQPYRLVYSATAEEEVCGAGGVESILDDIGHIHFGIIGEPTGMQMAVAERGLLVLDCTAHGVSGHAARSEGVNALYIALDDIEWFRTYQFERVSEFLGSVKMSVTMMECGTQHNVVPDTCRFVVDVRPNGMYTNQQIVDVIRQHVTSDVTPRSLRHNSSSIPLTHPVVQRGLQLGLTPFGSPTTSNQTVLPLFPTLKIGPGDSARSHTADEFICLSEISRATELYVSLLDNLQILPCGN